MEAEYDPAADEEIAQQAPQTPGKKEKNNTMKNKRRFSDEQIRLLESIFEMETKLEPRKKLQLARELGLQPRQVAIWFQNRRARWKSKQIEQDYRILRANYDSLATRFESLKKERQSLILQTQKLRELLAEPRDINKAGKVLDGSSKGGGGGLENWDNQCEPETETKTNPSFQEAGLRDRGFIGLQIENDRDIEQAGQPGEEFVSMDEYGNDSPASPEKLYGFDSADMFGHPGSNSQWLNF